MTAGAETNTRSAYVPELRGEQEESQTESRGVRSREEDSDFLSCREVGQVSRFLLSVPSFPVSSPDGLVLLFRDQVAPVEKSLVNVRALVFAAKHSLLLVSTQGREMSTSIGYSSACKAVWLLVYTL